MKPMKKIDTYIYKLGLWAGAALSLTACVDEDLSDCPPNVEMREITVSYRLATRRGSRVRGRTAVPSFGFLEFASKPLP